MRALSDSEVSLMLASSLIAQVCTRAWMGYGQVLFLEFMRHAASTEKRDGESGLASTCKVKSNFADWSIHQGNALIGTGENDREVALRSLRLIVNHNVIACGVEWADKSLEVKTDNDLSLKIVPFTELEFADRWAWLVRDLDGKIIYMTCSGIAWLGHEDIPFY